MFRQMRRNKQLLSVKDTTNILYNGSYGVLALLGDNDCPYALPINYYYDGDKIYFHCAKEGHKLDAIRKCPKASFCVVDKHQVLPEKYATHYTSVIVFGQISEITDESKKRIAIEKLSIKYAPHDTTDNRNKEINVCWDRLCMLEMSIEHMTGKKSIFD